MGLEIGLGFLLFESANQRFFVPPLERSCSESVCNPSAEAPRIKRSPCIPERRRGGRSLWWKYTHCPERDGLHDPDAHLTTTIRWEYRQQRELVQRIEVCWRQEYPHMPSVHVRGAWKRTSKTVQRVEGYSRSKGSLFVEAAIPSGLYVLEMLRTEQESNERAAMNIANKLVQKFPWRPPLIPYLSRIKCQSNLTWRDTHHQLGPSHQRWSQFYF